MRKSYLFAVLERAVKTAAQSALLVLGADQINAMEAAWGEVGGFALGGFVLSVLFSLASTGLTGHPSATTEHVGADRRTREFIKGEGGWVVLPVFSGFADKVTGWDREERES